MQHSHSTSTISGLGGGSRRNSASSIYTSSVFLKNSFLVELANDLDKKLSSFDEDLTTSTISKRPMRYMLPASAITKTRLRDRRPIYPGDGRAQGPIKLVWRAAKSGTQPAKRA